MHLNKGPFKKKEVFAMPMRAEATRFVASFDNGVLEIRLRRSPTAKSKEIKGKIS